jgi:hypothetical protein
VAYACLQVCLSSIDKTLCSLLQEQLASLIEFDAWVDLPWFEGSLFYCLGFKGSMVFAIEKHCVLGAALLS